MTDDDIAYVLACAQADSDVDEEGNPLVEYSENIRLQYRNT